jgi:hypothetical protein
LLRLHLPLPCRLLLALRLDLLLTGLHRLLLALLFDLLLASLLELLVALLFDLPVTLLLRLVLQRPLNLRLNSLLTGPVTLLWGPKVRDAFHRRPFRQRLSGG